jgi:hypothetical protein
MRFFAVALGILTAIGGSTRTAHRTSRRDRIPGCRQWLADGPAGTRVARAFPDDRTRHRLLRVLDALDASSPRVGGPMDICRITPDAAKHLSPDEVEDVRRQVNRWVNSNTRRSISSSTRTPCFSCWTESPDCFSFLGRQSCRAWSCQKWQWAVDYAMAGRDGRILTRMPRAVARFNRRFTNPCGTLGRVKDAHTGHARVCRTHLG